MARSTETEWKRLAEQPFQDQMEAFAAYGREAGGGISRIFGSEAYREAAAALSEYMKACGMESYIDPVGNVHGIWKARAEEKSGKEIKLDFQSMEFSAVLSSLSTGKIDLICSCLTVTDERKKVMDFSDPYLQTQDVCLILAKNKDQYQSLDDFKDKKLAANTGSSQEVRANSISSTVTSTPTVSDAILQLQAGKVDAIVVDNITAERYSVGSDDLYSFELSDDEVAPVDKAVGFQQGNEDLKAIINEVVKEQTESGNVDKWVTEYAKKAAEMGLNK